MELIKINEPESIKNYFLKVRELQKSGKEFPINLDHVWFLAYSRKDTAVKKLQSEFIENEDFAIIRQKTENSIGRPKQDYFLTVAAMEFFIAKKVKEVFEVYRQVFHKALDEKQKPLSQIELFMQSAKILYEQDKRLGEIESKLNQIEVNQEIAKEQLFALPFPVSEEKIPEISMRNKIRRMVNKLSASMNLPPNDVWNKVYQELYYAYNVSIKAKGKINKNESWLDVAERTGNLDKMYIVISNVIK